MRLKLKTYTLFVGTTGRRGIWEAHWGRVIALGFKKYLRVRTEWKIRPSDRQDGTVVIDANCHLHKPSSRLDHPINKDDVH